MDKIKEALKGLSYSSLAQKAAGRILDVIGRVLPKEIMVHNAGEEFDGM